MTWLFAFCLLGFLLPGCVCCGSGPDPCEILTDTMNSLAGFTQVAGTWSVGTFALTTSTNAVLISTTTNPAGTGAFSVSANLIPNASGDTLRLITAYKDANNYHFAEIKWGPSGYARLYKMVAGTPTQLATVAKNYATSDTGFILCVNDQLNTLYLAWVDPSVGIPIGQLSAPVTLAATPTGFGVGTGSTVSGTTVFNGLSVYSTAGGCSYCVAPCSFCPNGNGPSELEVTVGPYADTGSNFFGCRTLCAANCGGTFILPYESTQSTLLVNGGAPGRPA